MIGDKLGHGTVGMRCRTAEQLEPHADLRAPTEERRLEQRPRLRGNHHHETIRHRRELAVTQDVGNAPRVVGTDHVGFESDLANQLEGSGLSGEVAVRTGLDEAALHLFGADDPAQPGLPLDQRGSDSFLAQVPGSSEARDASTYDNYGLCVDLLFIAGWSDARVKIGPFPP